MKPSRLNLFFLLPSLLFAAACGAAAFVYPKGMWELRLNHHAHAWSDWLFLYVTNLGNGLFFALIVLALLFVHAGRALLLAFVGVACGLVTVVMKYVIYTNAMRPPRFFQGQTLHFVIGSPVLYANSFPSGHTMTAFALCFVLAQFIRYDFVGALLAGVAILVGISRVYLLDHFVSDVATGAALGLFIGVVCYGFLFNACMRVDYRLTLRGLVKLSDS